ncbi:MAG: hypothetical protein J6B50_03840 [Lachnospiraceae bacterium]|nr:hypothetical protein [Lachnospiraceae bacterium]
MHGEIVELELKDEVSKGKGCIVFDLSCYFPYANQEDLYFDFQVGEEQLTDIKLNHRYPNHGYVTISKKVGRKLSKLGYPYFVELNTQQDILLTIKIGLKDDYITIVFPIHVTLTQDKPVCALSMKLSFDKMNFVFHSYWKDESGIGWHGTAWTNNVASISKLKERYVVELDTPTRLDKSVVIYHTVLEPVPQKLKDLLV